MSYLYINESGTILGVDAGSFTVKYKDGMLKRIPIETLESVMTFGNVTITSKCMKECLSRGIALNYFSANGSFFGRLDSTRHVNVKRYKTQVFRSEDMEFRIAMSKIFIKAKISNQIVLLKRYGKNKDLIDENIKAMKVSLSKIDMCTSIDQIMGYEGSASRSYFAGLSKLIIPEFSFNGRNRQPPKDEFNSLISLGYTIVMYEIYGELENRGLNPYVGFMHSDKEKHPTLASDLLEEWRAVIVDAVAMSLIQGYEIKKDNFSKDEETGGVLIDKDGMKIFVKKMDIKLRTEVKYLEYVDYRTSFRKAIGLQTAQLAKAIEENEPSIYKPIVIR